MLKFYEKELKKIGELNTPAKIQDFINKIPVNFEEDGKDSCMSPISVLKNNRCHCIEGAFFAAACFWLNGLGKPLVVDMRGTRDDFDHVIAVFRDAQTKKWGAISKTNHAVLRYREPIYESIRELVMGYFHEYTDDYGNKTLREFSEPLDLSLFGKEWITSEDDLWYVHDYIDSARHFKILNTKQIKNLRKTDAIEQRMGEITEFKRPRKGQKI